MYWVIFFVFLIIIVYVITTKPVIIMKKPKLGILGAEIIYTDQKESHRKDNVTYSKILYSKKYELTGKPDYIFKKKISGKLTPVELKSAELKEAEMLPREHDLMQLLAYFLIIEDLYKTVPKEGRLIYKNCMFIVRNTKKMRKKVLDKLQEMREVLDKEDLEVQTECTFVKCRYCMARPVCKWQKSTP